MWILRAGSAFCWVPCTLILEATCPSESLTTVRTPELTNLSSTEQKCNALFMSLPFTFYSWYSVTHLFCVHFMDV